VPCPLQPVDEDVEAGGEALVAVVDPDVLAEGDQGGEAVGGQRAEELVELVSGGVVADALLVGGDRRAADRKAGGVVDDQEEGQAGLVVAEPGDLQWRQERLGHGERVRPERVAQLQQPGDAGVALQHLAQPVREQLDPLGPWQGGREGAVDLGEHAVKDQVVELLLVAHVAVERAGDHPEARGQGAHGERLDAVLGDDGERLGDHALAGERGAALRVGEGGVEPQRVRLPVVVGALGAWRLRSLLHVHAPER